MTRPFNRLLAGAALVVAVTALAAGCGGNDEAGGTTTDTEATTTAPTSGLRVALVADAGQLNDNGFNELAYKGLKRAQRVLGVQGRVVEAQSAADYIPNMSTFARQGYDLVIGVGFAQGDAIAATAKRFPDTHFAIVDVDQSSLKGKPANVEGLLFREEQVGYLVGYLGALEAKRAGSESISAVDGDQSFLGPHVLTSALKGVDSAVFLTIKAVQDGTFTGGGNTVFGLDQDG